MRIRGRGRGRGAVEVTGRPLLLLVFPCTCRARAAKVVSVTGRGLRRAPRSTPRCPLAVKVDGCKAVLASDCKNGQRPQGRS